MEEKDLYLGFNFSNSLKNRKQQKSLISDTILLGCACFAQEFQAVPTRQVNFNFYASIDEMKSEGVTDGIMNGSFSFAEGPYPETLTINIALPENCVLGCKRLFKERETPTDIDSLRSVGKYEFVEQRGNELMIFFSFMETCLHEFSHAVNYEKIMDATNWTDLDMPRQNPDYFLWDEYLARYRSILVALKMIPEMERELFYSIFKWQIEGLLTHLDETKKMLDDKKMQFKTFGFSLGELKRTAKEKAELYYAFDNYMATYAGTQVIGFIQACYKYQQPQGKYKLKEEERQLEYLLGSKSKFHKSRTFKEFDKKRREVRL